MMKSISGYEEDPIIVSYLVVLCATAFYSEVWRVFNNQYIKHFFVSLFLFEVIFLGTTQPSWLLSCSLRDLH